MKEKGTKLELTGSEISSLGSIYQGETNSFCGMTFFLQHVNDKEIKHLKFYPRIIYQNLLYKKRQASSSTLEYRFA